MHKDLTILEKSETRNNFDCKLFYIEICEIVAKRRIHLNLEPPRLFEKA